MDKLGAPRDLVRFATMQPDNTGADGWRHVLARPRVLVYGVSLLLLAGAMVWGWAQRPELRLNAMRDRGVLARQVDDGAVENVYRLQVMNASLQPRQLHLQALAGDAASTTALQVHYRGTLSVEAAGATTLVVTVRMSAAQARRHPRGTPVPIRLVVEDRSAGVQAQTTSTFLPG
jgi:polyferredoxin